MAEDNQVSGKLGQERVEASGSSLTTESGSPRHGGKSGVGVGLGQLRVCIERFGDKGPGGDG